LQWKPPSPKGGNGGDCGGEALTPFPKNRDVPKGGNGEDCGGELSGDGEGNCVIF
jgi:hypothetical protein